MEIEKKFLVKYIPERLKDHEKFVIKQGYITTDPVLRLRQSNDQYLFGFKNNVGDDNLVRDEYEAPLSKEQFEYLWTMVQGFIINKTRYLVPLENGLVAELDIYHEKLEGLYTVEVEFDDVESAHNFVPPDWFGDDVTPDKRYSNSSLSMHNGIVKTAT